MEGPANQRRISGAWATIGFAAVTATLLGWAALSPGSAAPVPPGTRRDPTPDLKALQAIVSKALEEGKWPRAVEEQRLKATLVGVFDGIVKEGELKGRKFPVDLDRVERADIAGNFDDATVQGKLVLTGTVRGTRVSDSIVISTGLVRFTSIRNSVVIGKTVRFTGASGNCLIVAEEFVRGNVAQEEAGGSTGPILVAGEWLRLTSAKRSVCHVLRPGVKPAPDDRGMGPFTAIRMNGAEGVVFLNAPDDVWAKRNESNVFRLPKGTLAK